MNFLLKIVNDLDGISMKKRYILSKWCWQGSGMNEERFVMSWIVHGAKYRKAVSRR
ncbi:MAG: hypothetical protein GY938_25800 [Ketobacter sp.]|nr:hypothetical protein [Ketobacter sp.]